MAASLNGDLSKTDHEIEKREEGYAKTYQKHFELIETLPKGKGWMTEHVVQYHGFWFAPLSALKGVLLVQNYFKARPTDIVLAAFMKCGTTWLRTLMFATMNRSQFDFSTHPLLNIGPHDCFPFLDAYIYETYPITDLEVLPSPRLFATHIPYEFLPRSMKTSACKFVYICRDPKDVLISKWDFMNNLRPKELQPLSLQEASDLFCEGIAHYGPFWDHVLGYWKASQEAPSKILFLKYEDMKREPSVHLKRLAEFLGQPFSPEEERGGVVEQIIKLCSFENLRSLEVNKVGVTRFSTQIAIENHNFFRKGEIGDWKNHLTDEMKVRLDEITEHKLKGSGLSLGVSKVLNNSNGHCNGIMDAG